MLSKLQIHNHKIRDNARDHLYGMALFAPALEMPEYILRGRHTVLRRCTLTWKIPATKREVPRQPEWSKILGEMHIYSRVSARLNLWECRRVSSELHGFQRRSKLESNPHTQASEEGRLLRERSIKTRKLTLHVTRDMCVRARSKRRPRTYPTHARLLAGMLPVVRKTVKKHLQRGSRKREEGGKRLQRGSRKNEEGGRGGDTKQSPFEKGSRHSSEDASGFLNLAPLQGSGYTTERRG